MEKETGSVKVTDRRRFDEEGNPRGEESTQAPPAEVDFPPEQAAPPPADPAEVMTLRTDLETARKRVDELARAVQAMSKEREEFKLRLTRERERLLDVERGNVALTLLEAIDELDLALSATGKERTPLSEGVRLIREGLLTKVQGMGIERLDVVGRPYDPNLAEAADMELTTEAEDDQKVVSELRAGYRMKDRVIRPARVKVAKYVQPAQA
jgi:molecular chaperone GrpE